MMCLTGCGMFKMCNISSAGRLGSLEHGKFEMWDFRYMGGSRCGMFRMWDVRACRMFGMSDVGCGMFTGI